MSRLASIWLFIRASLLAAVVFLARVLLVIAAIIPSAVDRRLDRRRRARLAPLPRRARPRVLLIGGTINHTTQVRQIAAELPDCDHAFTWYYSDGALELLRRAGRLENTALGDKLRARCLAHLEEHDLPLDLGGRRGPYDLAITCSDLSVPRNIRGRPLLLVQEGMTDREDLVFRMVKAMRLPPWVTADSAGTGLSHAYDRFCVASEGYRTLFERKGVPPEKIVVTGIPNFDNCDRFLQNDFPHRGHVLVCSSDIRETLRWENRPGFIQQVLRIAAGRQIIWKLHPNEKVARARRELALLAPGALVFESGNAEEMIANCDVLVTQFSSTAYVGLALGKEVHSYFDVDELRRLCPVQNGRTSAWRIANVCRELLGLPVERQLPDRRQAGGSTGALSI
ncbi:MAG TPA: hypothetical protein VMT03_27470 [Polyangia bacterium]|nr:hypothetical protein [Polyangia bacterium]